MLQELILVDDASDRAYLGKTLERHLRRLSQSEQVPAKVLRSPDRAGLVRARLKGAAVARGDSLVFLDAHCEVTKGWMEPLLHRRGHVQYL